MMAVKVLQAQDIEVEALCFVSNFFNADRAIISAEELGIKIHVVDISQEILALVKNPPHGYGKNMNPCIDCHGLMFKKAAEYLTPALSLLRRGGSLPLLTKEGVGGGFDFIATGEVLGQRPFSQNKQSLKIVEKIAGFEILRPLSAKLLPETEIERKGLVKRYKLLDIEGRSRERQMELAEKLGIKNYPAPAGGCLLTDPEFSNRLNKMLEYWPNLSNNDVDLLKYGRIQWMQTRICTDNADKRGYALVVIGRNKEDNESLEKLAKKGDIMVELKEMNGPLTLVRVNPKSQIPNPKQIQNLNTQIPNHLSEIDVSGEKTIEEIIQTTCLLTGWYAVKARGKKNSFKVESL
jgi:tRNA U34 2-thiouridine synthase MnmA/TrmU